MDRRATADYRAAVSAARSGLERRNCARLADLIRPQALAAMRAEAASLAPGAIYTEADLNPYFTTPPEDRPEDHPLRRISPRRHGMVRGDGKEHPWRYAKGGALRVSNGDEAAPRAGVRDNLQFEAAQWVERVVDFHLRTYVIMAVVAGILQ